MHFPTFVVPWSPCLVSSWPVLKNWLENENDKLWKYYISLQWHQILLLCFSLKSADDSLFSFTISHPTKKPFPMSRLLLLMSHFPPTFMANSNEPRKFSTAASRPRKSVHPWTNSIAVCSHLHKGASIYDVRTEGGRGPRNTPNSRTNSVYFADREGGRDKKYINSLAVIYGSPLNQREWKSAELMKSKCRSCCNGSVCLFGLRNWFVKSTRFATTASGDL